MTAIADRKSALLLSNLGSSCMQVMMPMMVGWEKEEGPRHTLPTAASPSRTSLTLLLGLGAVEVGC